ncbi:MAG: sugar phosphate isomerase/epimerase [Clostridia bacterium]|nr:sugar phosphate isomerase/epimerase [Clostridia bacterium]
MLLSINNSYFFKKCDGTQRTLEETLKLTHDFGFDACDIALCTTDVAHNPILRENYLDEAKKLREYADSIGLLIDQSHARFDYYAITREQYMSDMLKTVEVSAVLGVKNIVIHADTYYEKRGIQDANEVCNLIYDTHAPMVELAKKKGVNIACENLFDDHRIQHNLHCRFCSRFDELMMIVDRFNSDNVGVCWDFGHGRCGLGEDFMPEYLERVGKKLIATHVHDNVYHQDIHSLPYLGGTDWTEICEIIKRIGYKGAWTLELVYGCIPDELLYDFGTLFAKTGRYMIDRIEK